MAEEQHPNCLKQSDCLETESIYETRSCIHVGQRTVIYGPRLRKNHKIGLWIVVGEQIAAFIERRGEFIVNAEIQCDSFADFEIVMNVQEAGLLTMMNIACIDELVLVARSIQKIGETIERLIG